MSINNYIKDLLNIKDKNIVIDTENIIVKKIKYIDTKFIYGKSTYNPKGCPCCGHVNESFNIIKYGSKTCKIKLPSISNIPTILFLKKQRFLCKECGSTFSAKTDIVSEFSNISNDVKRKIAIDLTKIPSFKSIAESNDVSPNTIFRVFKEWNKSFKQDFSYLPPILSIDEFKPDEFGEIYNKIKTAISTAIKHLEKIKNTLNTNYNNGKIEGINNKIKVIKRVSYGYRSFDNFRLRVFLCFYHKKIYGLSPKT